MEATGIIQICSHTKIGIPLNQIGLNQERSIVVVEGHISREKGMSRRKQQVTTSSHNDKTKEERRRIKVTLRNKDKGRRYLKSEGEGTMNYVTAANSEGEAKSSSSSSVEKQMWKGTTSSPQGEVTEFEQKKENKKMRRRR